MILTAAPHLCALLSRRGQSLPTSRLGPGQKPAGVHQGVDLGAHLQRSGNLREKTKVEEGVTRIGAERGVDAQRQEMLRMTNEARDA